MATWARLFGQKQAENEASFMRRYKFQILKCLVIEKQWEQCCYKFSKLYHIKGPRLLIPYNSRNRWTGGVGFKKKKGCEGGWDSIYYHFLNINPGAHETLHDKWQRPFLANQWWLWLPLLHPEHRASTSGCVVGVWKGPPPTQLLPAIGKGVVGILQSPAVLCVYPDLRSDCSSRSHIPADTLGFRNWRFSENQSFLYNDIVANATGRAQVGTCKSLHNTMSLENQQLFPTFQSKQNQNTLLKEEYLPMGRFLHTGHPTGSLPSLSKTGMLT